jgi:hypothetical protein
MDQPMTSLRDIFDNTLNHPSDKWASYFDVYQRHLESMKDLGINLIEVGVQKGGSLDMWAKFFPNAKSITGIDIDAGCADLKYDDPRIRVVIGDQGDPAFWDGFLPSIDKVDVFIDDGGHFMNQQILTFEKVFPKIPVGGIFICEDCHTSYMGYNGGGLWKQNTFIEYAKTYIDVLHWNWKEQTHPELERRFNLAKDLTSVHIYDSVVVFEKFGKVEMSRVAPKS